MKQPELGKRITELRKSKGLTQEELVDRCNISVRTIQRIETGEVNPRSYTIKTILSALESDFGELRGDPTLSKGLSPSLKFAWIAGIAYFILGFPESVMDFTRLMKNSAIPESVVSDFFPVVQYSPFFYLLVKVLVLLSYLFFMRGFVSIGNIINSSFLSIVSKILLSLMAFVIVYDTFSIFFPGLDSIIVQVGIAVSLGALGVFFGIALINLRSTLSIVCIFAGASEIIAGIFFLFLNPIGLAIHMLAVLLEIILIFQMARMFGNTESVLG